MAAAKRVGYPVVLKVDSERVVHKSDRGGVALHLVDEAQLKAAFDRMATAFAADKPRFLGAKQAAPGRRKTQDALSVHSFGSPHASARVEVDCAL